MNAYLFPAALVIASLVSGCTVGAAADPSQAPESTNDDLTAKSVLVGTFNIHSTADTTLFNSLTLNSDHTFEGEGGCRQDTKGPHCFAVTFIKGKWETAKSGPELGAPGGVAELVFTDSLDQKTTYFYSLINDELTLRATYNGKASVFDKDISKLPKIKMDAVCADKYNNTLGLCPEEFPCEYDGPTGDIQRCLPPI